MDVGDHATAMKWLETVRYYRLSTYWLPFERPPENGNVRSKVFESGATLSAVTDLYVFDRRLRVLVLEAIERVEVHVRSRWTYHMAHAHGDTTKPKNTLIDTENAAKFQGIATKVSHLD